MLTPPLSLILSFLLAFLPLGLARFDVFAFMLKLDPSLWSLMPWDRMTTVCLVGWMDPELVSLAHNHSVNVVYIANYPKEQLLNSSFRKEWIWEQVTFASANNLQGVNFDFEDTLEEGSPESEAYTRVLKETVAVFHQDIPGSQVSVDVAWAPGGVDGRYYEYARLGSLADMLFVMGYDEQSQMWGVEPCQAKANSPVRQTFEGVRRYLQLDIPAEKLVLGVPWYGYRYPCINITNNICYIEEVPFRGCNCSDAVGREFPFTQVMEMLKSSEDGRRWDTESATPTFNYREDNQDYQVWYDDPESLTIKYQVAKMMGLGGTGFWTANFLDYKNSSMVDAMWNIIPE